MGSELVSLVLITRDRTSPHIVKILWASDSGANHATLIGNRPVIHITFPDIGRTVEKDKKSNVLNITP